MCLFCCRKGFRHVLSVWPRCLATLGAEVGMTRVLLVLKWSGVHRRKVVDLYFFQVFSVLHISLWQALSFLWSYGCETSRCGFTSQALRSETAMAS